METFRQRLVNFMKRVFLSVRGASALLVVTLSVVQGSLAAIFLVGGVRALVISNMISVFLYLIPGTILVHKRRYFPFLIMIYLNIQIHSLFACIYLGWYYNFSIYCISAMPISFIVFYLCDEEKINLKFIISLNLIFLMLVFLIRIWIYKESTIVPVDLDMMIGVSSFNMLVCGSVVILFSGIFVYQRCYNDNRLKEQTARLDFMANNDELTRLRNRRNINALLKQEVERRNKKKTERPLCVAIGDIDDFKQINDIYGHECGDMVLERAGSIFLENMQDENYVGRWGGEEILFLFQMTLPESKERLDVICEAVNHYPFAYDGDTFHISMTFGLAELEMDSSADVVLKNADKLMYQGKAEGKNRVRI